MHGMMRHADEIRLREIVDFSGLDEIEKVGSHVHRGYRRWGRSHAGRARAYMTGVGLLDRRERVRYR